MFYRLVGLKEKIELIKAGREGDDRLERLRDQRRELAAQQAPAPAPKPQFGNQSPPPDPHRPRLLEDFRPPPTLHRPGLAPAVPVIETTKYSTSNLPTRMPSTATPESKRKRDDEADSISKRQAVELEPMGPPIPKPSASECHQ